MIDARVLGKARKTIDIAAYVLTSWLVINAIASAAKHGAAVRLYVDGSQAGNADMSPDGPFGTLLRLGNITVKQKRVGAAPMHLKSYCVDGRWFRTGSANFTASGLKRQDNDLLLFDDREMCAAFTADFERVWTGGDAE